MFTGAKTKIKRKQRNLFSLMLRKKAKVGPLSLSAFPHNLQFTGQRAQKKVPNLRGVTKNVHWEATPATSL